MHAFTVLNLRVILAASLIHPIRLHAGRLLGCDKFDIVEADRSGGVRAGKNGSPAGWRRIFFFKRDGTWSGFGASGGPGFSFDFPGAFSGFAQAELQGKPLAGFPVKRNAGFKIIASVDFERFFPGANLQPVPPGAAESNGERRKAAAFGSSKDAGRHGQIPRFDRAKEETEAVQRRARQFEEFVVLQLLDGKTAVQNHKLVGQFVHFQFFKIVFVEDSGGGERVAEVDLEKRGECNEEDCCISFHKKIRFMERWVGSCLGLAQI